uniref:Uncharacterized protein n=1 Tax=Strongyloides papillosus TaxID=174720 RepID=A0A0N5B737_STREA
MSDNQFISKIPSLFRKSSKDNFTNHDDTINFIQKKNPRQVLSESFVNSPMQPLETPMNSTARSPNMTMSSSSGPNSDRRNVTPRYSLRSKLVGSAYSKFNAGVTPAQMDPFKNINFKINQDPEDVNKHGEFLNINDTFEKDGNSQCHSPTVY